MKTDMDTVAEIPCFKCLFWEWKKDSHLYCNPSECEKLTKWLLGQVEKCEQEETDLTVATTQRIEVSETPKQ